MKNDFQHHAVEDILMGKTRRKRCHTGVHVATLYRIDVRFRRHVPAGFTPYILAVRSKETSKIILDFHAMFSR